MSQDDCAGHEPSALGRHSPPARARDLGNQTMRPQHPQQPGDLSTSLLADGLGAGRIGIQAADDVAITEPLDQMLPFAHRLEQQGVVSTQGIQSPHRTALAGTGPGQTMHLLVSLTRIVHLGQGPDVPLTGGLAQLEVVGQIGNPLGHGEIPQNPSPLLSASTQDLELTGLIDDRLDP